MTTALAFGTFDLYHPGHEYYLNKAKDKADELIVIIARDANVKRIKNITPKHSEKERAANVRRGKIADRVLLGSKTSMLSLIKRIDPDIICLGYDQKVPKGFKEFLKDNRIKAKIVRIRAHKPHAYKSSKMHWPV